MKKDNLNKYMEAVQNIDEKQRYYIFGGILLLIFLLDYFVLIRPQLSTLMNLSPKIKILNADIEKAETDFKRMTQYRDQVKELKEDVDGINVQIKTREEVPKILGMINSFADQHSIKIDRIMPEPQDQVEILEKDKKVYYHLPIYIEARSGYHEFGRFLNQIEKEAFFLKIATFSVSSSDEPKQHRLKLTLNAIIVENAKQEDDDNKREK